MSGLDHDERAQLRAAARGALSGADHHAAARAALDGAPLPDSWPLAISAGWPGLLAPEAAGGTGLGAGEAMLVACELGRALSGIPLLGHLVATALLSFPGPGLLSELAAGARRAAWLPVRPDPVDGELTSDLATGPGRGPGPRVDAQNRVTGTAGWVPDATGADVLVVPAAHGDGRRCLLVVAASDAGIEPVRGYDASRRLAHVRLTATPGMVFEASDGAIERAWALGQALLAAESVGAAEYLLDISVEHARRRVAFGRPIGSFQAVKHQLVEVLRRLDKARALIGYAEWAFAHSAPDIRIAASALRHAASDALDTATRTAISVHGGMGATWEHPAALFFRRAQLSRRLLGGQDMAARDVGRLLLHAAATAP